VEASGWPAGVETEEQKRTFIEDYRRFEGVSIDPEKMKSNAGRRTIAKLFLNSLWGKLAQMANPSSVTMTDSPEKFHAMFADTSIEILDFEHVNEQLDRVVWRKKTEFCQAPKTNNIPVAIFVTSHARLHLYSFMEQVEPHRLLYCDTDSIFYVWRVGERRVTEGERLGQMMREESNRRIVEFVSGGPKNYGYRHVAAAGSEDERCELKIRGFELTYAAKQEITFERMKRKILRKFDLSAGRYGEFQSGLNGFSMLVFIDAQRDSKRSPFDSSRLTDTGRVWSSTLR
jgi:hypothetical protein